MNATTGHDLDVERFDDALRSRHDAALAHLSVRVRSQLAQRRNAALRGERPAPARGLRNAAIGFAAIGALAVGLALRMQPSPAPTAHDPSTAAAATPASVPSAVAAPVAGNVALDQDPDFYAWLGSADSSQLAME